MFVKIYETVSPILDHDAGINKDIAQWQVFSIFFIVLLIKVDAVGGFSSITVAAILFLALFANLIFDAAIGAAWILRRHVLRNYPSDRSDLFDKSTSDSIISPFQIEMLK